MNQEAFKGIKPSIEEVRDQFTHWREGRKKRTPIPKHLWQASVELSQKHSIYTISKALGLSYSDLKKRVQHKTDDGFIGIKQEPSFIELDLSQRHCIVEMENTDGARMRISVDGAGSIDLLGLAKAFLGMSS